MTVQKKKLPLSQNIKCHQKEQRREKEQNDEVTSAADETEVCSYNMSHISKIWQQWTHSISVEKFAECSSLQSKNAVIIRMAECRNHKSDMSIVSSPFRTIIVDFYWPKIYEEHTRTQTHTIYGVYSEPCISSSSIFGAYILKYYNCILFQVFFHHSFYFSSLLSLSLALFSHRLVALC